MAIHFLGHAAFELLEGDTSVLVDPFLTGNPKAAVSADDLNPDVVLLTHGHADHIGDTVSIAKRSGASAVAIVELANELGGAGLVDLIREHSHTCYLGERGPRHDWGYGCGECPACALRAKGWREYVAG